MSVPDHVSQFVRKQYTVEGEDLDKAKTIKLTIEIDGKKYAMVQAREPGIVAFVSRPDAQGFDIEIVEAGQQRYVDRIVPSSDAVTPPLEGWQIEALGLKS